MNNKVKVVLVDKEDNELGTMDKLEAHKNPGTLHRAISVILVKDREKGKEVLIQKRSKSKPLWPMFWDCACSTHPMEGESYEACAERRLKEEMGIDYSQDNLKLIWKLYYQADYNEELSEHELDGILVGEYPPSHKATEGQGNDFKLNSDEVAEAKWVSWDWLVGDMKNNREIYAPWFLLMMDDERLISKLSEHE